MAVSSKSSSSVRYAFDDAHRLVIRKRDTAERRWLPPRTLEGRITTDRANRLIYLLSPASASTWEAHPKHLILDGTWRLTSDHRLALALHAAEPGRQQTLYLRGALVRAEASAVTFALHRAGDGEHLAAQRVSLSGRWAADARNRLNFLVEKADGSHDRLTLQAGWELGPRHALQYRYRQHIPGARRIAESTMIFDGQWDITQADRLRYRLLGSTDSTFEFTARLQSPSLVARSNRIVYQLGIGVSGGGVQQRQVVLSGTWKLNRDLSLAFDIPYAHHRFGTIRFEGAYALGPRGRVIATLYNSRRQPLGLSVTFTRALGPEAELFVRLRKDAEETAAIGGVRVRF